MVNITHRFIITAILATPSLFIPSAYAVNWLSLQGITDSPYPLIWGFLQPAYFRTSGSVLPAGQNPWQGQKALNNVIQPDLSSSQVFQIQRTRIGIRGALPDNEDISYFVLAEYGNNGITQPGGGAGKVTLTDATVTFAQLDMAKIRIGQMKIPMSEEIYQGIITFNYVNLSNIVNQQLVERPFWTDGKTICDLGAPPNPFSPSPGPSDELYLRFCNGDLQRQFRGTAVAGRDVGIQIFNSFTNGAWEHSYALLIGQGGANKDDRNDSLDYTVYLSSEKIYGGKKALRRGYKLYTWLTSGKRSLYDSATLAIRPVGGTSLEAAEREYDRKLSGFGATYFDGKYRVWAELINVKGMIFTGSSGGAIPGAVSNNGFFVSQFTTEPKGKGDGGYLDFGYRLRPDIELDLRYDWYNRLTNLTRADKTEFETWTLGLQYFFSNTTKAIVNYELRDMNFPGQPASSVPNQIAAITDDRLSAQIFLLF